MQQVHDGRKKTMKDEKADAPQIECLTVNVPIAGQMIGLGKSASYEAARRGDIPTIRIGGRLAVPLAKLKKMFE